MSGPWEKYATKPAAKPWEKYAKAPMPEGAYTDATTGQVVDPALQKARQNAEDENILRQRPVAARAVEVAQGLPFVGEWLDEAVEVVSPRAAQNMRDMSDAMERQNPVQSGALNVAGGILSTAPLLGVGGVGKAADWIAKGGNALTRGLRAGALASPAGAAEGAASFAGRADPGKRGAAAAQGAAIGGTLALGIAPLASAIGSTVGGIVKGVKKLDVSTISEQFGISKASARVVKSALLEDDLNKAAAHLSQVGDDALLGEAGPATRNLMDSGMASGGAALRMGREAVDARVSKAATRFQDTVKDLLGSADGGIRAKARGIRQASAKARQDAYDFAYSQPTPMAGRAGRQIEDVLSRVKPSVLDKAVENANDLIRNDKMVNQNIMASIDDAGQVTFSQPLSVVQLDYLARGLGDVVDAGTDAVTGKMTPQARIASEQLGDLRNAMKGGIKGYARALKLGGEKIRSEKALEMGRKLTLKATRLEDVRDAMKNASLDVRESARMGFRENLDDIMSHARSTIADFEAGHLDFETGANDVAQAVAAVRNLTSEANVKKMRAVMGGDAPVLLRELQAVGDAMVLRAAVARNSATAIRQATQRQMAAETAPGLVRRTAGNMGNPFDAAKEVSQSLASIDPASIATATREQWAEIMNALTSMRGPEAQRALDAIRTALESQPVKDLSSEKIGQAAGGTLGLGLYQSGEAALTPRGSTKSSKP